MRYSIASFPESNLLAVLGAETGEHLARGLFALASCPHCGVAVEFQCNLVQPDGKDTVYLLVMPYTGIGNYLPIPVPKQYLGFLQDAIVACDRYYRTHKGTLPYGQLGEFLKGPERFKLETIAAVNYFEQFVNDRQKELTDTLFLNCIQDKQ